MGDTQRSVGARLQQRGPLRRGISRRSLLKGGAALLTLGGLAKVPGLRVLASAPADAATRPGKVHVVVVGAGAFGGWTALHLLRKGARVTLLDAWGPGNSRASSGGETRILRSTYGPDRIYVQMVARALVLWRENEARWSRALYRRTGAIWMPAPDDAYERAALPVLREEGIAFEELSTAEAGKRFPQVNFEGVKWILYEREAGYLLARRACQAVLEGFLSEGGEYRQSAADPGVIDGGRLRAVALSDGSKLSADQYVFACGPWLGKVFPGVIGERVSPTRQEVFFFGTQAGDPRFLEDSLPVWIDNGERRFYGIPGSEWRGFKVADDTRGAPVDPTSMERMPTAEALKAARDYMEFRFPGLKGAPLLESRVCQYENSPDSRFILDRHPRAANVWIVGGGSGHGFKHGPAVGERMAELVLGLKTPDPFFSLSRFAG